MNSVPPRPPVAMVALVTDTGSVSESNMDDSVVDRWGRVGGGKGLREPHSLYSLTSAGLSYVIV